MCHDQVLNLKEVARHLGVHYMTAYRYVRAGRLRAHRVGNVWMVDGADLAAFANTPEHGHALAAAPDQVDWAARLRDRLVCGDEAGSWATVEAALTAGHQPEAVLFDVIARAVAISDDPEHPSASHLAVATADRVLAVLASRFRRRGRSRGTVVLGTPPGEAHSFALSTMTVALRLRNIAVLELGTSVPAIVLVDAARRHTPITALAMSVTTIDRLESASAAIKAVRAELPELPVVIGGQAVRSPEVAELTGATSWAVDAEGVVALIEALLPPRRSSTPFPQPAVHR